jgi:hypothetical protein
MDFTLVKSVVGCDVVCAAAGVPAATAELKLRVAARAARAAGWIGRQVIASFL